MLAWMKNWESKPEPAASPEKPIPKPVTMEENNGIISITMDDKSKWYSNGTESSYYRNANGELYPEKWFIYNWIQAQIDMAKFEGSTKEAK